MRRLMLALALCALSITGWSAELPDAVCGNGEVTGNTHCVTRATISSIPMPTLASSPLCIALLAVSGIVLWRMKK